MAKKTDRSTEIQAITGLSSTHFADLIRTAQLMADPGGGISGRWPQPNWEALGVPCGVVENLRELGHRYQYRLPHISPSIIWDQLTPESRSWVIDNRTNLWQFEELFPALDED